MFMRLERKLIRVVSNLRKEGMKGYEIAEELGVSRRDVTILSRGYTSERAYLRDLNLWRRRYIARIENNLDRFARLGWPIKKMIVHRSAAIYFSDLFESVENRKRDLKKSLQINTERMGLDEVAEEISVDYHNGIYFLKPQTLRSRAFLPPYANIVLKREVEI